MDVHPCNLCRGSLLLDTQASAKAALSHASLFVFRHTNACDRRRTFRLAAQVRPPHSAKIHECQLAVYKPSQSTPLFLFWGATSYVAK